MTVLSRSSPRYVAFSRAVGAGSRLLTLGTSGLLALAILVGRMHRPPDLIPGPAREHVPGVPAWVRGVDRTRVPGEGWWLDPRDGAVVRLDFGLRLSEASFAPWKDSRGRLHVAGVSSGSPGQDAGEVRLIRAAWPGGEVLDEVPLTSCPAGPPCWAPDGSEWVLFPGRDGRLHSFDFTLGPACRTDGAVRSPRPLAWEGPYPPDGPGLIRDVSWPSHPQLRGFAVASINGRAVRADRSKLLTPRLWWLRFGPDLTTIEAAGRLMLPTSAGADPDIIEERFPATLSVGGGPLLAYLERRLPDAPWQLRVVPLDVDDSTGSPVAREDAACILARECHPTPPILSADGRAILCLLRAGGGNWSVGRFEVGRRAWAAAATPLERFPLD